ncbi:hypothetical protein CNE_BB1p02260 (plasmid) [Cupriavidus necator N-1]|uniref:Uncharacterized protein n=1 Tax=Cupriavidus necator (strain ATCC 43291 / DSM 13513 / CCUG 52238 / LMG 8453 / N-1) TaxID=1042878 RepID=F8GW08_CUPNN|nr:hypothetical protein CNE_BB1p02260 [Cupriavidus necator N-1]
MYAARGSAYSTPSRNVLTWLRPCARFRLVARCITAQIRRSKGVGSH